MQELFKDYCLFLRTGKTTRYNNELRPQLTVQFGKLFLLFEIVLFATLIVIFLFVILADPPQNETHKWIKSLSPLWGFLIPGVIGPVVEEFAYRYWLKATKLTLVLSSLFVSYVLINNIINSYYYRIDDTFVLEFTISFGIASLMYLALSFTKVLYSIQKFWEKNALILLWVSILWFGFSHVRNFPLEGWYYFYAPIMVLPQLAMGTVLALGRLKYGIFFSLLIHMIHNSIF